MAESKDSAFSFLCVDCVLSETRQSKFTKRNRRLRQSNLPANRGQCLINLPNGKGSSNHASQLGKDSHERSFLPPVLVVWGSRIVVPLHNRRSACVGTAPGESQHGVSVSCGSEIRTRDSTSNGTVVRLLSCRSALASVAANQSVPALAHAVPTPGPAASANEGRAENRARPANTADRNADSTFGRLPNLRDAHPACRLCPNSGTELLVP